LTVFSPRAHGWTLPGWGRQTDCSLWGLQPSTAFSLPGARATQSNHRGRRNDIAVPCATANRCTNSGFGEARSAPSGDGAQARYRRAGQAQARQSGAYGETPRTNLWSPFAGRRRSRCDSRQTGCRTVLRPSLRSGIPVTPSGPRSFPGPIWAYAKDMAHVLRLSSVAFPTDRETHGSAMVNCANPPSSNAAPNRGCVPFRPFRKLG
jgi:hypothetical protein